MHLAIRKVHEAEVANVQEGIRLKHLHRGIVVTHDKGDGTFEVNIFVVPTYPADRIKLRIDTRNPEDDDRMTFGDLGM